MTYIHGCTGTKTYIKWKRMRQRCFDVNCPKYPIYGGRGIKICDRWKDYRNFLLDMGECPDGLSLGRINNDGDYCPENCRWEDNYQQQNNTRKNRLLTHNGITLTMAQWSRKANVAYKTLWKRLNDGWPINKALFGGKDGA